MKKFMVSLLIIVAGLGTTAFASPSNWAKPEVELAIQRGSVPEHLQNNYQAPITREEFAELFTQSVCAWHNEFWTFNAGTSEEHFMETRGFYALTPEILADKVKNEVKYSDTNNKSIIAGSILGMFGGYPDGTFKPDKLITREEASLMLYNYGKNFNSSGNLDAIKQLKIKDLNKVSNWAMTGIVYCFPQMIQGDSSKKLNPQAYYTREQAIATINRLLYEDSQIVAKGKIFLAGWVPARVDSLDLYEVYADKTVKVRKDTAMFEHHYMLTKLAIADDNWDIVELPYKQALAVYSPAPFNVIFNVYSDEQKDIVWESQYNESQIARVKGEEQVLRSQLFEVQINPKNSNYCLIHTWKNNPDVLYISTIARGLYAIGKDFDNITGGGAMYAELERR